MSAAVYVVSAARTPIGSFLGALASVPAPRLGATAIKSALERAGVAPEQVGAVFMGNVLSAGIGQAPARQAAIYAGVPHAVPATTVSKVCGSGLEAVVFGTKTLRLGDAELVVAGGMESMSNVPYYLREARSGYRMGDGKLVDGMIFDGLWDPYNDYHMGQAGELCAKEHGLTPLARIVGYGGAAQAPEWFTTAPALAIESTLKKLSLSVQDIDLWEINEAFSCVTQACTKLCGIDPSKVNVRGGAVALGHPIGASGARILVTLLGALAEAKAQRGLATLCIGGGEAVAVVVERC